MEKGQTNSRYVERPMGYECQRRFFEAIDFLKDVRLVTSLSSFCARANINKSKYRALYKQYRDGNAGEWRRYIDVAALVLMCSAYPINGEWLLSGRGSMLRKDRDDY